MNNYLLPSSIIIAAIIIAFGMGHLASEIRIAQMCDDVQQTMQGEYSLGYLSSDDIEWKYAELCTLQERELLPRLF